MLEPLEGIKPSVLGVENLVRLSGRGISYTFKEHPK